MSEMDVVKLRKLGIPFALPITHVVGVVAPPCSGKTTAAQAWGWIDGDQRDIGLEHVNWPTYFLNLYQRCLFLPMGTVTTFINGVDADASGLIPENIVLVMPSLAAHHKRVRKRNLTSRDTEFVIKYQRETAKLWAKMRGIKVVPTFQQAALFAGKRMRLMTKQTGVTATLRLLK
jgi:hypothetical protein